MDIINNSITNLEKKLEENIKLIKDEYHNSILETSTYFKNVYQDFDNSLLDCFPVLNDNIYKKIDTSPFNPKLIIDYSLDNRQPEKILREGDWDTNTGFLLHRKEMYEIDLIQCNSEQLKLNNNIENTDITNIIRFLNTYINIQSDGRGQISIRAHEFLFQIKIEHLNLSVRTNNRGYIKFKDDTVGKIRLIIDNYLNIYCKINSLNGNNVNIYFCFNKILFPDIAFTTDKKLRRLVIDPTHNILVQAANLFSKDAEQEILEKAKNFIPENYNEVYNYFEGFRKLGNWHMINIKDNKQKINDLEQKKKDLEIKINDLEIKIKDKQEMINKYKSLLE